MPENILVFDIGKTHVKLVVVGENDQIIDERRCENTVIELPPYPQFDIAGIWDWFVAGCREFSRQVDIGAVVTTTHGSVAALIDPGRAGDGLTLPVADYEFTGFESSNDDYEPLRPPFAKSYSPSLSGGLNIGRQLYWQQTHEAEAFAATRAILLYPQYWAWRLSGQLASEVTSIGCHSDLWEPVAQRFSDLAIGQRWDRLFPAFVPAWKSLGSVTPEVAAATGLPAACRVLPGLHDSNAGLLRYLHATDTGSFTLVSSGTWTVSMRAGADLEKLDPSKDMLANVDAHGRPVACARYMGGREYEKICDAVGADVADTVEEADISAVIRNAFYALPDFSGGSGPFCRATPRFAGEPVRSAAVAAIYSALMIDYELDLLFSSGDVIVEGVFAKNPAIGRLLAKLRAPQSVYLSSTGSDVVLGGALTARGRGARAQPELKLCEPAAISGLRDYQQSWRQQLPGRPR